jgi:hypothetical protein
MIQDPPSYQEDSRWSCNPAVWVDRPKNRCAASHALLLGEGWMLRGVHRDGPVTYWTEHEEKPRTMFRCGGKWSMSHRYRAVTVIQNG